MKEILGTYKDRLVNLSGKNRSLAMKKLYKKRTFDLYNIKEFNENIYEDILEYVNDATKDSCCIVNDYSIFFAGEKSLLDEIYDEKRKSLKEYEKTIDDADFNKDLLDKKQRLEDKYQNDLEKLERKRDKLISYSQSLKALNKEISDIEKETGKKELYLAYPFVEGNFKDGTFFKAPLMLYQVALKKDGDRWLISSNADSKVTINKVLLLAIEKYNEIKVEGIKEEYEDLSKETITKVVKQFNNFGVYFDLEFEQLKKVAEYTAKNLPKYNLGSGKVIENIVLGQFPLSNSIHNDYEELINKGLDNELLKSLLKTNEGEGSNFEVIEEDGKLSFSEEDLFFISQLDYSQELAVKKSSKSDKLVIYGPPGTGKSQTITNIISNSIANDKKVLMVSQKRAALDVIYNRLGELNSKAIIIHDVNSDKKKFYSAISNALGADPYKDDNQLKEINENSKLIDEKILSLEKLAKVLNTEREIGLTLQEMYSKTKVIESKSDLRFDKFMRYRKFASKEGIDRVKYDDLVLAVEKIDNDLINAFLKYQELVNKNSEVENLDTAMNSIEISEAVLGLENALAREKDMESLVNDYKDILYEFWKFILEDREVLSENKLKLIAKALNENKNKDLMILCNSGEWWKVIKGDDSLKQFIHSELRTQNYNFAESDLEAKVIDFYSNNNKYLLEKIEEKSWIKRIFNGSKNKKKEEENQRIFNEGLDSYKRENKRIALEISKKYFENEAKDRENQIKLEKSYQEIFSAMSNLNSLLSDKLSNLEVVKNAFSQEKFEELKNIALNGKSIKAELEIFIESLNMLESYSSEITRVKELSVLQRKLLINSILEDGTIAKKDIESIVEFSILQNILNLEKDKEVSDAIKYIDEFESIVDVTNEKMRIKQELVKTYIINKCQMEIETLKYGKEYKEFKRQADKKRALWPIRKYMENYNKEVLSVFSCFLLGPETVSNVLPLINGLFDVVIFDEASQMFIEDAIPTIYRAKKVIIAGDDKQLRPSGTFKSTVSEEVDEDDNETENLAALEEESLLDLAKINYDKVHLTYHYRSQYEELISFSNYAFYDGRLKVSPNKISGDNKFRPIERIKCNGRWIDRSNIEEANEVVELVYKTLLERKNMETIGIITFNINQKNLIEDMLELKAQNDSVFRKLYIKELDRIENSEDVSLFVKNIENVQGDERDIIIFSIGYGKNENGRVSVNFGSLSQDGGENRLNVAISRAKKKIYLITSIEPEELNVESSKNRGPRLFKKYLQYVRAVSNGNREEVQALLNSLIDSEIVKNETRKHDSDFEAEVYDALVARGFEVHTQVGVSGYKIDMAIYDRERDEYILGIECDGAAFHSSKSARERDIHRQRYLESRGWKIERIWSKHWWKNPKNEIDKIQLKLQELKKN